MGTLIVILLAIGLVLFACCNVAGDADRQMENINRGYMEDYNDRQ